MSATAPSGDGANPGAGRSAPSRPEVRTCAAVRSGPVIGAARDRDVRSGREGEHRQRVARGRLHPHVARHRGQPQHPQLGSGQGEQDGQGVIVARIAVQDDGGRRGLRPRWGYRRGCPTPPRSGRSWRWARRRARSARTRRPPHGRRPGSTPPGGTGRILATGRPDRGIHRGADSAGERNVLSSWRNVSQSRFGRPARARRGALEIGARELGGLAHVQDADRAAALGVRLRRPARAWRGTRRRPRGAARGRPSAAGTAWVSARPAARR